MKIIRRIYHFLGGIYFAIGLIFTTMVVVIAGTFIEAKTDSHLHAAQLTYGSPFFAILLWLFFVNILFSATRRWPFKLHHIPFLITHLGLLMVIGGTIIKNSYGTQGILTIMEGSGTNEILFPDTYALHIAKRDPSNLNKIINENHAIMPQRGFSKRVHLLESELKLTVTSFLPHVKETLDTWVKGNRALIAGYPSFPAHTWDTPPDTLPPPTPIDIDGKPYWSVIAVKTNSVEETLQAYYMRDLNVSLNRQPTILFVQNLQDDVHLFAFDEAGRTHHEPFLKDALNSFISYDGGFSGYTVQATIPFGPNHTQTGEQDILQALTSQLREALQKAPALAPPLQFLHDACVQSGEDFTLILPQFLQEWQNGKSILYPTLTSLSPSMTNVMNHLDWHFLSLSEQRGCLWTVLLFDQLEQPLREKQDLIALLEKKKWPLLPQLIESKKSENVRELLLNLSRQMFTIADKLPTSDLPLPKKPVERARFLSAYLKAYDIDDVLLSEMTLKSIPQFNETLNLETPITMRYEKEAPSNKLEDNHPLVSLLIDNGNFQQSIALSYQRFGMGFKWPILGGEYLIRFQPEVQTIPYHLRLRQARQINYPHSSQPYSYESDIIITQAGKEPIETTLSMNRVYESWDGYRFYLSNISPALDGDVKRIQVIVNHDPAKYFLTYPGAIIITLGIILLFWLKPYFRIRQEVKGL